MNLCTDKQMRAINIYCGVCGLLFYQNLSSFLMGPPSQPQLTAEIYTGVPPIQANVEPNPHYRKPGHLDCRKHCFGKQWPLDNKSGVINLYGFDFGLACSTGLVEYSVSK